MLKEKSFTLIELLVVIAIIGILSAIALVSLGNVRVKARDSRRMADMRQMITAQMIYYGDTGSYFIANSDYNDGTPEVSGYIPDIHDPLCPEGVCSGGHPDYKMTRNDHITTCTWNEVNGIAIGEWFCVFAKLEGDYGCYNDPTFFVVSPQLGARVRCVVGGTGTEPSTGAPYSSQACSCLYWRDPH